MKKILLGFTVATLLSAASLAKAEENTFNHQERNFQNIKQHILYRLNEKSERINKMKTCVNSAQNFDNLKDCRKLLERRHHDWRRGHRSYENHSEMGDNQNDRRMGPSQREYNGRDFNQ